MQISAVAVYSECDRTAIHATPKGKILEADEVKFRALPRTQASKKAQP